jgi:hypothetical protein
LIFIRLKTKEQEMSTIPVQFCPMLAVAVEMSGAKWLVGTCAGVKLRRKSLDEETALARMEALVAEVEVALRKFGGDERTRVVIAYEAGQEAFWLQRMLISRGMNAEVIDPVSLKVDRRGVCENCKDPRDLGLDAEQRGHPETAARLRALVLPSDGCWQLPLARRPIATRPAPPTPIWR